MESPKLVCRSTETNILSTMSVLKYVSGIIPKDMGEIVLPNPDMEYTMYIVIGVYFIVYMHPRKINGNVMASISISF